MALSCVFISVSHPICCRWLHWPSALMCWTQDHFMWMGGTEKRQLAWCFPCSFTASIFTSFRWTRISSHANMVCTKIAGRSRGTLDSMLENNKLNPPRKCPFFISSSWYQRSSFSFLGLPISLILIHVWKSWIHYVTRTSHIICCIQSFHCDFSCS